MENNFRSKFQQLLENTIIPGHFSDEDKISLWKNVLDFVIPNIPKQLFRFRSCEDYNIEAVKHNTISLVKPTMFSDKYDSLVYIDENRISNLINEAISSESILSFAQYIKDNKDTPPLFKLIYNDEIRNAIVQSALQMDEQLLHDCTKNISSIDVSPIEEIHKRCANLTIDVIRNKGITKIACFTEDVCSKIMWDRYADGYKGFALEYDFSDYVISKCSNCSKKCLNWVIPNLLPVIYSDNRYDATELVNYYSTVELSQMAQSDNNVPFPDILFWLKAFLYKDRKAYEYEKEWRFLTSCDESIADEKYVELSVSKPNGIYYGPDISPDNKEKLHKIALEHGIKEYEMYIDDSTPYYLLNYKPC